MPNPAPVLRDQQTYAIIGAAMAVHRQLGNGFLEAACREALLSELTLRSIPCSAEVGLPVMFNGRRLRTSFRADLVCFDEIIVELKTIRSVEGPEQGRVLNYLKASGLRRALLLNFGSRSLEYRRLIWSPPHPSHPSQSV